MTRNTSLVQRLICLQALDLEEKPLMLFKAERRASRLTYRPDLPDRLKHVLIQQAKHGGHIQ